VDEVELILLLELNFLYDIKNYNNYNYYFKL